MKKPRLTPSVEPQKGEITGFWLLVVAFNAALFTHVGGFSLFFSDDIPNFLAAKKTPFVDHVLGFLDVHFVPLFQAANWLFLRGFGFNFPAAMLLLGALQLLSVKLLHDLLQYLCPGRAARLWTVLYATSIFLIIPVAFWSAGLHRIPCLLFTIVCLHGGLRFAEHGNARDFFFAQLGFVLALAFFEKGMLAPVYLVGAELCRRVTRVYPNRSAADRVMICVAPMLGLCALQYSALQQHVEPDAGMKFDAESILTLIRGMLPVLLQGPFLIVHSGEAVAVNALVWLAYGSLLCLSVLATRRAIVAWIVGLGWLVLNCVMIAASNRRAWVAFLPQLYRYYHEMMLPFVLSGALLTEIVRRRGTLRKRFGWTIPTPPVGTVALTSALLVYGTAACWRSAALASSFYPELPDHRRRILSAIEDAREMVRSGGDFAILDTLLAPGSIGLYWGRYTYADVFHLVDLPVRMNLRADRTYAVNPDGRLVAVTVQDRIRLYPGPYAKLVRTSLGPNKCLVANNPFGSSIDVALPATEVLENAVVIFDYQATQPDELFFFQRADPAGPWMNRHRVTLPETAIATLLPIRPLEAGAPVRVAGARIELTVRDQPFCLRQIRLAGYSFPP